jgi:competence protein ComEC
VLLVNATVGGPRPSPNAAPPLVIRFLDVGQGDSVLLEPRGALPILVDTGPPGSGVAGRLRELGVSRLGALAITHDQSDHAGALGEILGSVVVDRLLHAEHTPPERCTAGACPPTRSLARGSALRAGRLQLDVLWPPPHTGAAGGGDPNAHSLVLRARIWSFDALLTGDAEAEVAPVAPGPVDVLKVAHHGSADESMPALLERTSPALAVISVGDNPYGHPAPATLGSLADAGVPVRRTDADGEVVVEVGVDGWTVG